MNKLNNKKNELNSITSKDNKMKIWDSEEEDKLIDEINNLLDIKQIAENHKRTEGGIKARLKKIIDSNKKDKLKEMTKIIKKYFTTEYDKEDLNNKMINNIHDKILGYDKISEIIEEFKISELEVKKILYDLLDKEKNVLYKSKLNSLINESILDIILSCNSLNDIIIKNPYLKIGNVNTILKNILKNNIIDFTKKERIKILIKKYNEIIDNSEESINNKIIKKNNNYKKITIAPDDINHSNNSDSDDSDSDDSDKDNIINKVNNKVNTNNKDNKMIKEIDKVYELLSEMKKDIQYIKKHIQKN